MPTHLSDAELLARLVGFDSTSRNSNLPIADFLCEYLDRPGVRIARNPSADGTKANVIAWLGPAPEGDRRGLVLSGHMDVVPAEEDGWRHDPFHLADEGDRWVGRGSCDMKGFLALAANLMVEADPRSWRAPLVLVFTYDEEVGTLGAKRLTESFPEAERLPRSAVIGEPTSLRVARTHKGHTKLRLTLHGGSAINVVPDRCVVEVGFRPLPGITSEELIERVSRAARQAAGPFEPAIELLSDSPPLLLDEASPIHRHLCAINHQEAGSSVSFATDAGWLQRLGMDCAIFGPGSIEVAHKPNEFLPKDEFVAARGLLERTIRRFCEEG